MTEDFIYLASKSPRRQELLAQIGIEFKLLYGKDEDSGVSETPFPSEMPSAYVKRIVQEKAQAAVQRWRQTPREYAPILVADTVVVLGGKILGKPKDSAQAFAYLNALSGRTHRVLTAIVVATNYRSEKVNQPFGRLAQVIRVSRVTFARLTDGSIRQYLATGEFLGKAGAYGIQGRAAQWIRQIEGSYSSIMGLPLYETAQLIQKARRT